MVFISFMSLYFGSRLLFLYNLCCGVSAIFIVYINDIFHCLCYGQHFLHVTLLLCLKAQTQKELRIQKLKNSKILKGNNIENHFEKQEYT